jgi:hypothetical protein
VTTYGPPRGEYCRRRKHALCYEVIDSPGVIVQSKRRCCHGALGEICWGERLSPGEMCHDVGRGKRKVTLVLLGQLVS